MKWSFATVGIMLLGLIGVSIILLFQQITTTNENDYYLLKEVTEAAMIDAIDIAYYRETGDLKIVKEKFVENFTRRFAESTIFVTSEYTIDFYDIIETPPKVSIIINTGLGEYNIGGNAAEYDIANKLDAILEYTGEDTYKDENPYVSHCNGLGCDDVPFEETYYAILSNSVTDLSLRIPDELKVVNIKNIEIENVEYIGVVTSQGELNEAVLRNQLSYNNVDINMKDYLQSIDDFSKVVSNVNLSFYNCYSRSGQIKNAYDCRNNNYYVSVNGDFNSKIVLKYKIIWSYDEYKFSY